MTIYDITRPLSTETATYPGDPPFAITTHASMDRGDPFELTSIAMSSHLGTHVDACRHFVSGGPSVDRILLETLVGPATVRHLEGTGPVGVEALQRADIPDGTHRLLLRIGPRCITLEAAAWLSERGVKLVGVDTLSIDPIENGNFPAHRLLLSAGIVVVESLDLASVPERDYTLYCLPLKVVGAEAAPARAILVS